MKPQRKPGKRPPLGVMPLKQWRAQFPEPTLLDLNERYADVSAAVERFARAGHCPSPSWLQELLGVDIFEMMLHKVY